MKTMQFGLTEQQMTKAWERRDADFDGLFVFGVKTTGIFCRPSCPSTPKRENLEFFESPAEAVRAGYRPCRRCEPELANGRPPEWVQAIIQKVAAAPEQRFSAGDFGAPPEKVRRWFQKNYGMTFAAWRRGMRLSRAFGELQSGQGIDDVVLGNGYESHSGFREAFGKVFGRPPGQAVSAKGCLRVALIETPIGPMLAAVNESAVCELVFADRRALEVSYDDLRRRFKAPVVPGESEVMRSLRRELELYFRGELREFSTPVHFEGTDFQLKVWRALLKIEFGKTASYEEIAKKIGAPSAFRAVARANASNRICILIPCHRVIAKDGGISGYGGGVFRKRCLLELEQATKRTGF